MGEIPDRDRQQEEELQDLYRRLRDIERAIRSVEELERISRRTTRIMPEDLRPKPPKDCTQAG
jgi:hypothetical protein